MYFFLSSDDVPFFYLNAFIKNLKLFRPQFYIAQGGKICSVDCSKSGDFVAGDCFSSFILNEQICFSYVRGKYRRHNN